MSKESATKLAESLRALAEGLKQHSQTTKFSDSWGWQALPLDKTDLRYMAELIAAKIESVDWTANDSAAGVFDDLAPKVDVARQTVAPQLFGGPQASEVLAAFLSSVNLQVEAQVDPGQILSSLTLPASLHKHVTAAKLRLQSATTSIDGIDEKISAINRAYDAAERLPATQEDIAQALKEIATAKTEADGLTAAARQSIIAAEVQQKKLESATTQAQATLEKLEDAYRAAISQGLAKAFSDKAVALNKSMLLWALVLLGALLTAGLVADGRFPEILQAVTGKPDWGVVMINVVLGGLTVAPAIWLAWVATKQIGQRFRLSEDYAYKAALSAAYEGYRSEAARLDPLFEARLFSTALGRLDELPLRLVEPHVHGSPWHEFLSSTEFKQAAEAVPALKDRLLAILRPAKPSSKSSDAPPPKPDA